MAYYVLYAHLEKQLVKKGDILNGKHNVGIIGQSGNATGKHLHLQVETELPKDYAAIRGFDKFADPSNPDEIIKKYGKMCQNTVTQPFWNYNTSINSPNICGGHHSGIDYSGVIDLPTESKYCYSPEKAKCKVIAVGSDPYNYPHWGGYGNYVIIEILGKKQEKKGDYFMELEKLYTYDFVDIYKLPNRFGGQMYAHFKRDITIWDDVNNDGNYRKRDDLKGFKEGDWQVCDRIDHDVKMGSDKFVLCTFTANKKPKRYYYRAEKR